MWGLVMSFKRGFMPAALRSRQTATREVDPEFGTTG
jgi:hypothetical protein